MLADYASRMRLRNVIIVGALGALNDYDPRLYIDDARDIISSLVTEHEAAASRLEAEVAAVENVHGNADHAHDYHSVDATNLRRRVAVSRAIARKLEELRGDDAYLIDLIERVRGEAWQEVSRALEENLSRPTFTVDADYEQEREGRMQQLITDDLAKLARGER